MNQQAYTFNKNTAYKPGGIYAAGTQSKLTIAEPLSIGVSPTNSFTARVPDIFSKYKLPNVTNNHIVDLWGSQRMGFWQNQCNFAFYCATTGCGVSAKDHLSSPDPLIRSLYVFHVYYQARRILAELRTALPEDPSWNAYENSYDQRAYERLCSEFGVDPNTDWRRKGLPNYGLGAAYRNGHRQGDGWFFPNHTFGWKVIGGNLTHVWGAPSGYYKESFTEGSSETVLHLDGILQDDSNANTAWTTFILDESQGFTQAGVVRVNDSIRTYVWCILGAQAQTRTRILGSGTAFDAQKQFLALLEDRINSPVDLPESIKRYQDMLQNASSKLDFVYGIGLYMSPSDMLLRIGKIEGYNNDIVIAQAQLKLGLNVHANDSVAPPAPAPIRDPIPVHHEPPPYAVGTTSVPSPVVKAPLVKASEKSAAQEHENEKTALIVGSVTVGLIALWFLRR